MGRALAALALLAACAAPPAAAPPADGPYLLVLGTAQDAGLPQIGCREPCCVAARERPALRRRVASLLIADPRDGRRWLIDATPDLREQVERAAGHPPTRRLPGPRPPLFDGVFLTHAHMGHYAGLLQLGIEAYDAKGTPVFGTAAMTRFLETQAPWDLLVRAGNVEPRTIAPGERVRLAPDLAVTAVRVPHREEYTDTVGYLVEGPRRAVLYVPDIDKWERWERALEDALAEVDVALLDGSFFDDGEIPGRDMADIPHPFIRETIARLGALPAAERAKVRFTHLNHSNPAADPASDAAAAVRAAGMTVARDGDVIGL